MNFIQKISGRLGLINKSILGNVAAGEREDDVVIKKQLDTVEARIDALSPSSYSDRSFSAGNYTGVSGLFTATSLSVERYQQIAKTLYWQCVVDGDATLTPTHLKIKIPNSLKSKSIGYGWIWVYSTAYVSGYDLCYYQLAAGSNDLLIYNKDDTEFLDGTYTISLNLVFEVE